MPVLPKGKICPRKPEALDGAPRPWADNAMVKALARAFRWRKLLDEGVHGTLEDLANAPPLH